MFIELTDHLRCPADHDEAYLVLLPDRLEGRRVLTGLLGCPVCGREVRIAGGVPEFDATPPAAGATALTPDALQALVGIEGPGGFLALVGAAGGLAEGLAARLPGVHLALLNPPAGVTGDAARSVLRAAHLPFKRSSLRSVVLGGEAGGVPAMVAAAVAAVLPGNRIVVEGPVRQAADLELLGEAGGVWVGRKVSRSGAGGPGRA